MEQPDTAESPRKRQKTSTIAATDGAADLPPQSNGVGQDAQSMKELDVGITELVTADSEGFSGILKKR
jgi:tRNA pseudouridine13 synthase